MRQATAHTAIGFCFGLLVGVLVGICFHMHASMTQWWHETPGVWRVEQFFNPPPRECC